MTTSAASLHYTIGLRMNVLNRHAFAAAPYVILLACPLMHVSGATIDMATSQNQISPPNLIDLFPSCQLTSGRRTLQIQ